MARFVPNEFSNIFQEALSQWGAGKCKASRYTNADLKISLYDRVHMKIIHWKCGILNPKNFHTISPNSSQNVCLQTYTNNRIC